MKVTEILSKPVISLLNSRTEGIVKCVTFDKNFKRLKWIVLFDNNEHLEEKALKINNIYSFGENAIVIKDDQCLNLEVSCIKTDEKKLPINNEVYTTKGKYLGRVKDIVLDEKYYIQQLILNNDELIDINKILASGEDAVIVQDEKNNINISSLKRKKSSPKINAVKIQETEQKVTVLNEINDKVQENSTENEVLATMNLVEAPESEENEVKTIKAKYSLNNSSTPLTVTTNYNFLIGRKLEKNVYSPNKELIARKNVKITKDIINRAKLHCKLREIIKYSK